MSLFHDSAIIGASGSGGGAGYSISRSLRFNSSDSAYLSRTPGSAGNRKTWTWAAWVKRSALSNSPDKMLFSSMPSSSQSDSNTFYFGFESSSDKFQVGLWNTGLRKSTAVYRDASAWYHVVVALDTPNATAANRLRVYINGVEITTWDTNATISQNTDYGINQADEHRIGAWRYDNRFYDGLLADIHFCDGTAYDASAFGEFDATTGVWVPKAFTGSYGTNGSQLKFEDNSAATAAALGKDASGNGNNWTPNNLSVTAGAGNDSLVDVPTNGSEVDTGSGGQVRGNYCTLNPLFKTGAGTPAYSNGNLDLSAGGSGDSYFAGTFLFSTGKYYYEATINAVGNGVLIGVCRESDSTSLSNIGSYRESGTIYNLDTTTQTSGSTYTTGDVIGVAIDCDNGEVQFYKNGVGQGATPSFTFTAGTNLIVRGRSNSTGLLLSYNFGQRPFAYTAPSGFKALCTANLPAPVVTKPSTVMDVKLYTGNGSTQTISGLGFSPDLIWVKSRSAAYSTTVYDTVRGAYKSLATSVTNAEGTNTSGLSAFNSDGFSLDGENNVLGSTNVNAVTYAGWTWDAGSSTVTDNTGSIQSSRRTNALAGISIVGYTGNGTAGATVGHGLGVAPAFFVIKKISATSNWTTYHQSLGAGGSVFLNLTDAYSSDSTRFNNTAPSSTVVTLGAPFEGNTSGATYVMYCFAPVAGYASMSSFVGNGSTDGPFCFTGFRPRFLLLKASSSTSHWHMMDTAREPYNQMDTNLFANLSNAELTDPDFRIDFLSNGFKLRTSGPSMNASGVTYVWAAWAESPFNYARAR